MMDFIDEIPVWLDFLAGLAERARLRAKNSKVGAQQAARMLAGAIRQHKRHGAIPMLRRAGSSGFACVVTRHTCGKTAARTGAVFGQREHMRHATAVLRKSRLTTSAATAGRRGIPRYCRDTAHGSGLMQQDNSAGIVTGLVFVTVFLIILASFGAMAKFINAPSGAYELAGSSRPAK
jgi:hypothetical protein